MTTNLSRRSLLSTGSTMGLAALIVGTAPQALALTDPFPGAPVCVVSSDHVTIKQSMTAGTNVNSTKEAQCWLNRRIGAGLAVDGKFGPATHSAVVRFQRSKGLAADGVVGPATWKALIYGGSAPAPSNKVEAVIGYARAQLGKPYSLGAEGPTYFDCSGLTLRSYQAAGVTLRRTSEQQRYAGTAVSAANRRRGDLMWWPGHVGIYLGDGRVIHASGSQRKVVESAVWGSPTYRRIV